MAAIFLLLSEESAALSDKGNLVTRGLKNDAEEGMSLYLSEFLFEDSAVFTQVHPQWFQKGYRSSRIIIRFIVYIHVEFKLNMTNSNMIGWIYCNNFKQKAIGGLLIVIS